MRDGRLRVALMFLLFAGLASASDLQTPAITPQELQTRQEGTEPLLVVDVRDVAESKSGHVPGAVNVARNKLDRQIDKLQDASGVVLYCINGRRTRVLRHRHHQCRVADQR